MTENENGRPKVYTPAEVAEILKIGQTKVYELLQRGEIRSRKIGKLRRIPAAAIDEFLERQDADEIEAAR